MNPLPDRTVILGLVATVGLVFALAFWQVRLNPPEPMLWRDAPAPAPLRQAPARPSSGGTLL